MISDINKQLMDNPEQIKNILEKFGFSNIDIRTKEIRCGIDTDRNATSVRIRLNEYLSTTDFGRNIHGSLISYIIKAKQLDFKKVIDVFRNEIGLSTFDYYQQKCTVFDGFYDRIKKRKNGKLECKIYDENILNEYNNVPNLRFLKDNISIESQKEFNVMYDIISQRIVFPIYNCYGEIIGVKGRANWEIEDDEAKYLYLVPCSMSHTLYGYSQNYLYLDNNKIIIVESEKSVMQAYTYGFRNIVALGGNSLSTQQCKLIMGLQPSEVVFAMDEGLDIQITKENLKNIKLFSKFLETKFKIWDSKNSKCIEQGSKKSITDCGLEIFNKILREELIDERQLEVVDTKRII